MAKPRTYTRLLRPVAGLASYQSLWQADDHLMLVRSSGYEEQYQRFNYADIRCLCLTPSSVRLTWALVWGFILLMCGLFAMGVWSDDGPHAFVVVVAALATLFLLINEALGPTCKVTLVTRVAAVTLPVRRRRKAQQLVARLNPLILQAQADLVAPPATPESIAGPARSLP
jgi:hypothetical protein